MLQQGCLACVRRSILMLFVLATSMALFEAGMLRADEPDVDLSKYYGFGKLEIFKLEQRSENMHLGDLNADGLTDLAIVDNSHSRIDLLQQRAEKPTESSESLPSSDVNELGNGWRFEHRKIPVDEEISAMTLGDFNHDGRTDIAYFGSPDRLVIRHQPQSGDWTERVQHRVPDVPAVSWSMASGDLNGDEKDDLVVLGKNVTYVLYQQESGKEEPPLELMNTSASLQTVSIADLDGDGRNDLSYLASVSSDQYLCARLQDANGQLGPELQFDLNAPRSVTLANIDGKPGQEILSVDANTNRVKVLQLQRPESQPGELAGRLIQYGFGRVGADRNRDLTIGDLDGDGLTDVVVTDPEAAQMIVYRQRSQRGLDSGSAFPGLVGTSQVRVADLDGNQKSAVVVLSTKEKTLAISRLENERLTFPVSLPVEDEPIAFELADLNTDGRLEILYICKESKDRRSHYTLYALARDEAVGEWEKFSVGESTGLPLLLRGTPTRLMRLDANRDKRPDFLIFTGFNSIPQLLTTDENNNITQSSGQQGIGLGEISPGALFSGQLDEPALLVARKNFARNLKLDAQGQWKVIDQYNAGESNAKIVGSATMNLDGMQGNEIILIDAGVDKIRVLRRDRDLFRPWREVDLGGFPYRSTLTADLNGDGSDDLLLFGRGKFGVLYAGQTDPKLKEIATFETQLKRTFFGDVVAGDLNADQHVDLTLIDTRSHYIELVDFDENHNLRHALHFKLFEEKSIARGEGAGSEPREAHVADVTNDGRADLILLAHDRVLIYPQDDGK